MVGLPRATWERKEEAIRLFRSVIDPGSRWLARHFQRLRRSLEALYDRLREAIARSVESNHRCLAGRGARGVQRAILVESDSQSSTRAQGEDSRRRCYHHQRGFSARLALEEDLDFGRGHAGDCIGRLGIDLAVMRVIERRRRAVE